MSKWEKFNFERKVITILSNVPYDQSHHFGMPYSTPYQIAIEFAEMYPDDFKSLDMVIGGSGADVPVSLTSYIANQLSTKIKNGQMSRIEGAFLSNQYIRDIEFIGNIHSSNCDQDTLSLFRLK